MAHVTLYKILQGFPIMWACRESCFAWDTKPSLSCLLRFHSTSLLQPLPWNLTLPPYKKICSSCSSCTIMSLSVFFLASVWISIFIQGLSQVSPPLWSMSDWNSEALPEMFDTMYLIGPQSMVKVLFFVFSEHAVEKKESSYHLNFLYHRTPLKFPM